MRAIFASVVLAFAMSAVSIPAYADGMDTPPPVRHHHARPHHRPQPVILTPAPAPRGPETVTLSNAFFSGAGVGTDIGTGFVGGGGRTIVNGGTAIAVSFSQASASAQATASSSAHSSSTSGGGHGGGWGGGHGGNGGGCGCGH